jgi:RNA polymerase sigma-70 factor (ECF subfamily)
MLPHLDASYSLARWLLREPSDAEDAVQDAFLRAQRGFERFRGGDGRAWLLTIVRNVCYSKLRQAKKARAEEAFDEEAHGASAHPAEANAVAWQEVRTELLQTALEALAPEYREVIVLHEVEGFAYREIASIAGLPLGTVMSRLARARGKLQAELQTLIAQRAPHEL